MRRLLFCLAVILVFVISAPALAQDSVDDGVSVRTSFIMSGSFWDTSPEGSIAFVRPNPITAVSIDRSFAAGIRVEEPGKNSSYSMFGEFMLRRERASERHNRTFETDAILREGLLSGLSIYSDVSLPVWSSTAMVGVRFGNDQVRPFFGFVAGVRWFSAFSYDVYADSGEFISSLEQDGKVMFSPGAVIGFDVQLSKKTFVGVGLRYMGTAPMMETREVHSNGFWSADYRFYYNF